MAIKNDLTVSMLIVYFTDSYEPPTSDDNCCSSNVKPSHPREKGENKTFNFVCFDDLFYSFIM